MYVYVMSYSYLIFHFHCIHIIISLIPRLSWGRRKETLVMTACACANPYQQNMVSRFSVEKDLKIGWRWCLEDLNEVSRLYINSWPSKNCSVVCMDGFFATSLYTTCRLVDHLIVYYASQAKKLPCNIQYDSFSRAKTQHIVHLNLLDTISSWFLSVKN